MTTISITPVAFLMLAVSTLYQGDIDREKILVLNIANAPIELINKGHTLTVMNRSMQTIVSYRLGCARFERKLIKITFRLEIEKDEIPAGTGISSATFDLLPDELRTCQDLKSRLVPLRAVYKNGQSWSLSATDVELRSDCASSVDPMAALHLRIGEPVLLPAKACVISITASVTSSICRAEDGLDPHSPSRSRESTTGHRH
jgi:hypothetical protein